MNIAVCNYRYFIGGGSERYLFSIAELLSKKGNKVIPFSVNHKRNRETEYSNHFIDPIGNEVFFENLNTPALKAKFFMRGMYSFTAKKALKRLIKEQNIELAYLLQITNYLSPSIINACKAMGIPVVWRLSDYQLLCPNYYSLRNGQICELCKNGKYWNAVKYKCLKDSRTVSFGKALGAYLHKSLGLYEKVDAFITPSLYLKNKLEEIGFSKDKIHWIPSFFDAKKVEPCYESDDYILFAGQLSKEKGIGVLLKALDKNIKLIIAGDLNHETAWVKDQAEQLGLLNVKFVGQKSDEDLFDLMRRAKFLVVPSVCIENTPQVIYEAFACGKPVITSNHGSLTEQVDDMQTGLLFEPGNHQDLSLKIDYLLSNPSEIVKMGKLARLKAEINTPEEHYKKLNNVFNQLLN